MTNPQNPPPAESLSGCEVHPEGNGGLRHSEHNTDNKHDSQSSAVTHAAEISSVAGPANHALSRELRKRADHLGLLMVDPPRPHPDADLLRRAADALDNASCAPSAKNYLSALSRACARKSDHFRAAARFAFITVAAVSTAEKLTRNLVSHLKTARPTKMTMIANKIALSTPATRACHPTLFADCAYAGDAKIIKMVRVKYGNLRLRSVWLKYVADLTASPSGKLCRAKARPLIKSLNLNEPNLVLPAQKIGEVSSLSSGFVGSARLGFGILPVLRPYGALLEVYAGNRLNFTERHYGFTKSMLRKVNSQSFELCHRALPSGLRDFRYFREEHNVQNSVLLELCSSPPPATNVGGTRSVETGFSLNHGDELSAGHSSGLSDADLAHKGDEPSRSVELNSEVSGDDHPDAPVWHGEGNTAVSADLLPNLAVESSAPAPSLAGSGFMFATAMQALRKITALRDSEAAFDEALDIADAALAANAANFARAVEAALETAPPVELSETDVRILEALRPFYGLPITPSLCDSMARALCERFQGASALNPSAALARMPDLADYDLTEKSSGKPSPAPNLEVSE